MIRKLKAATALLGSTALAAYPSHAAQLIVTAPSASTPTISTDFTKSFDARGQFTRASSAWDYTSTGALKQFASGAPAIASYGGNGTTNLGLGIFGATQNNLLNSEAPATQTRSLAAGTHVVSTKVSDTGTLTPSGTGLQPCGTKTSIGVATGGTNACFYISATTSVAFTVNGTLTHIQDERQSINNIAPGPQSRPIVTTTAAVTVAGDFLTYNLPDFYAQSQNVTYRATIDEPTINTGGVILDHCTDKTATATCVRAYTNAFGVPVLGVIVSGVVKATASTGLTALTAGALHNVSVAITTTGASIALDGGVAHHIAYKFGSTAFSLVAVGSNAQGTGQLGGYITSFTAWGTGLNDQLVGDFSAFPIALPPTVMLIGKGQSNETGEHAIPALSTVPLNPTHSFMPNDWWGVRGSGTLSSSVFQYTSPGFSGVVPCVDSNGPTPPYTDMGETSGCIAAAQVLAVLPSLYLLSRIEAAGGQTCAQLAPGSHPYQNAVADVSKAASLWRVAAKSFSVGAVWWDHGTSDAVDQTSYDSYYACRLNEATAFNAAVKSAVGSGQGDVPILEILMPLDVEGSYSTPSYRMDPARAQYDLAFAYPNGKANPLFHICGPGYQLAHNPAAGPHYANTSQDWKGEMLGFCYADLQALGRTLALAPTSIAFNATRTAIEITWNNTTPLQVVTDPAVIPQGAAANLGFSYADGGSTGIAVTGAAITSTGDASGANGTTEIALSGPVPAGVAPRIRSAFVGKQLVPPTFAFTSLSWSNGTVTAVTAQPHGLTIGQQYPLVIQNNVPAAYNGSGTLATPTDAMTLTWPLAANPGAATTLGSEYAATYSAAWSNLYDSDTRVGLVTGRKNLHGALDFDLAVPGG